MGSSSVFNTLYDIASSAVSTGTSILCGFAAGDQPPAASQGPLTIGSRQLQVQRLLGEGGFSNVFLAQDQTNTEYALKRMLCHDGTDALEMAQREIEAGQQLSHPNIVPLLAHLVEEHRAGARYVYMLFPLYKQGNLLDLSMRATELGEPLSEEFIIHVFRGICAALEYLHGYKQPDGAVEAAGRQHGEYSSVPQPPPDLGTTGAAGQHGLVHGDIKLGNVMLADDGKTPILMDFGSVRAAHIKAHTRTQALQIQDDAAQRCTMPYRAPELFDVQRDAEFDARTDVWALGCLLFALAYGFTPFEDPHEGPGASIALAAANARYRVPEPNPYSQRIPQLIAYMLEPDPQTRPFIGQVIAQVNSLYK